MKLQYKILIAVLVVFLSTISIIGFISIQNSGDALLDRISENMILLSNSYSDIIDTQVEKYQTTLHNLASNISMIYSQQDEEEELHEHILSLMNTEEELYKDFQQLILLNDKAEIDIVIPYTGKSKEIEYNKKVCWNIIKSNVNNLYSNWESLTHQWGRLYKTKSISYASNISDFNTVLGYPAIIISAPIFIFHDVEEKPDFIGVINVIIPIEELISKLNNIKIGLTGGIMIINKEGYIIKHYQERFSIEDKLSDIYNINTLSRIEDVMTDQNAGIGFYKVDNTEYFISFAPIKSMNWSLGAQGKLEDFIHSVYSLTMIIIISSIVGVIIAIIIIYIIISIIMKPVKRMGYILKDISEGEGDLTNKVDITTNDEIGIMAKYFNLFIEKLKIIIHDIKEVSNKSTHMGENLSSHTESTSSEISTMIDNIHVIKEEIFSLDESISNTSGSVENIIASINTLSQQISNQATSIEEASASIEEMLTSIQNIAKSTESKKALIDNLTVVTKQGGEKVQNTNKLIQEIADSIDDMQNMVEIINNISGRTNLLAMNASIEAAHAGESGKGFAVVANEIRKLSTSTGENAKNITESIKSVITHIDQANTQSIESGKAFSQIRKEVSSVSEALIEISNGMSEFSIGSNEILKLLANLSEITHVLKSNSDKVNDNSTEIKSLMNNIKNISNKVSESISKVTTGTEVINQATKQMNKLSIINKDNIKILDNEINKFKTNNSDNEYKHDETGIKELI